MIVAVLRAAFVLIVAVAAAAALAAPSPAAFRAALQPAALGDGAQRSSPEEWWRLCGHLRTADGHRFAIAATFFRFAIEAGTAGRGATSRRAASRWASDEFFPATFALIDESQRRYTYATRLERGAFGFGRAAAGRLDVAAGAWSLRAADGDGRTFVLRVRSGDATLDLRQTAQKPRVAFGRAGLLRSGCARCVEHAFAYTRLRAAGTLRLDGVTYALVGRTWLDHEYGARMLGAGDAGWDRFAIQLDDGRDVLVRVVRRADGTPSPATSGELVAADGTLTDLGARDVAVTPVAHTTWRSAATGARYPVLWELAVPKAHLDLAVVPPLAAQEIVSQQGGPAYYEGSIDVERAPPPGGDPGSGFAELTGYRRPVSGL